jgi:hypothetical protein
VEAHADGGHPLIRPMRVSKVGRQPGTVNRKTRETQRSAFLRITLS